MVVGRVIQVLSPSCEERVVSRLPKSVWCLLAAAGTVAWAAGVLAADPAGGVQKAEQKKPALGDFLRVRRDASGEPEAMETAIVRYVPAEGKGDLKVDLIGCVHIAQRSYYAKLNKRFQQYDVVLYELVAPRGTRIPKGGERDGTNPLVLVQQMAESMLDLESQTEHIDYMKENFVHADMSPDEIAEAMRKRGDDGMSLLLSAVAEMTRQQNLRQQDGAEEKAKSESFDLLSLLLDPNPALKLKRMLADQFEEFGPAGLGDSLNTLLIEDRNEAAMRVFQTELAKGHKRIAIFYGAGHMADFEKRLTSDFGLKRQSIEWMPAWNLRP
jgi:hypothetical protein